MTHVLGTRLDAKLALRSGVAAILVALAFGAASIWGLAPLTESGFGTLPAVLSMGVCPALALVSSCSMLRHRGVVTGARAIAVLMFGLLALASATATWQGIALGFAAADAGTADSLITRAVGPLFLLAWLLGTSAAMLVIDSAAGGRSRWR